MYQGIGDYGDISGGKNVPGLGYYYWRPQGFYPKHTFYPGHKAYYRGVNGLGAALEPGPTPTIKRGSKGEPVQRWQKFLGVTADGDFGPGTEKATKTWQGANSLTADGVVGPATWAKAAIMSAPSATPSTTFAPGTPSSGGIATMIKINPNIISGMAKPAGSAAAASTAGGGWWSQQSMTTKLAIAGGGVAAVGVLAFLLLGKKTRTATPNPGRRRRRRKSPFCAAAVRACDGPMLRRRAR